MSTNDWGEYVTRREALNKVVTLGLSITDFYYQQGYNNTYLSSDVLEFLNKTSSSTARIVLVGLVNDLECAVDWLKGNAVERDLLVYDRTLKELRDAVYKINYVVDCMEKEGQT
jgi:hypothetical protein